MKKTSTMKYFCTVLLLMLSLMARGQSKPLADRLTELERMVERLNERVLTLEAMNRVLADERKSLRDSLFVVRELLKSQYQKGLGSAAETGVQATPQGVTRQQVAQAPERVPEAFAAPQASLAVTPEHEATASLPLKASAAPAVRSTSVAPKPTAPRARPAYRSYIRGPRGGCYYINSSGNKTYVDRSLCG